MTILSPATAPDALIVLRDVRFSYGDRVVLDDVSFSIPRGKVTALMGASGGGKTTVLRLIGGQQRAQHGELLFDGNDVGRMNPVDLYKARRRMGMLFQFGALFTDSSVLDNVAFPIREHTQMPERLIRDIALMKLDAVGLRGARDLMPAEISGGMARRVALARAIALDPELVMYDEPFAGLDPISLGTAARLIRQLNDAMGLTSIVVSHDIDETFRIADHVVILAAGKVAAQGTPDEVRQSDDPLVHQFVNALPNGPVKFHYPGPSIDADFGGGFKTQDATVVPTAEAVPKAAGINPLARLGFSIRAWLGDLGNGANLFWHLAKLWSSALGRFSLVRDQVHFLGNHSLAIVAVSGLFVGFVLSLQGYYTLQRYGSAEALGLLVALSLVRELGPVITALLFAGRAGTSLTAEIGLMKAGEQLSAMEMMAIDPVRRILAPRLWGGIIALPLLAAVFSAVGIIGGWLVGVMLIGIDPGAFWSQMQGGVDVFADVGNGVIKSLVFGIAVTFIALLQGFEAKPTPEGVSRATTRTVVVASLTVLGLDFILTAMMFSI